MFLKMGRKRGRGREGERERERENEYIISDALGEDKIGLYYTMFSLIDR